MILYVHVQVTIYKLCTTELTAFSYDRLIVGLFNNIFSAVFTGCIMLNAWMTVNGEMKWMWMETYFKALYQHYKDRLKGKP
jgi:hypothetical protein